MDLARSSANASADEMTPRLVRDFPRHKAGALAQTEGLKMTTPETLSNMAAEAISGTSSANKFHLHGSQLLGHSIYIGYYPGGAGPLTTDGPVSAEENSIGWMPISLHCYANIRRHQISDDMVREKIKELVVNRSIHQTCCAVLIWNSIAKTKSDVGLRSVAA
jgi:hypothetical protein